MAQSRERGPLTIACNDVREASKYYGQTAYGRITAYSGGKGGRGTLTVLTVVE